MNDSAIANVGKLPLELPLNRRVCVAPMLDWTDRHCRYFLRQITQHAVLYSEMVTSQALIHGGRARFLAFDSSEHPVALQLGGSDPQQMALCAKIVEDYGYDEVNINVGCPSDRVQSGQFGACLMATPEIVADCVSAMQAVVDIPVTVKTRIGIDRQDDYEPLFNFIDTVSKAGCEIFIIHARKAWLDGLSPKENRDIPPLNYERVYQLKADFPQLEIIINGGICDWEISATHLKQVDGVMIGREAYSNPYSLITVDQNFYGKAPSTASRHEVLNSFIPYLESQLATGTPLGRMAKHTLGLFQGVPGARAWRRYLSDNMWKPGADISVITNAARLVQD